MKLPNFIQNFKKYKVVLFFIIIFTFTGSYFLTETINYDRATYECSFTYNEEIDENQLLSVETLNSLKNSAEKYSNIDVEKLINTHGILLKKEGSNYTIITYSRFYESFYLKSSKSIATRAKMFIKDLLINNLNEDELYFHYENIVQKENYISPFLISGISTGVSIIISSLFLLLKKVSVIEKEEIYDNTKIFTSPFHKNYWKESINFYSTVKKITTLSMLFALLLLSKLIKLHSGFGNLGISFGFIFFSIICLTHGPIAGLLIGFLSDVLGYFLFDSSSTVFFIGYTFQAMLTGFIYGLFMYKTKITYFKILLMRIIIGIVCNVVIGSLCWGYVAGYHWDQTFAYMFVFVLPKNIVYLIPQSTILYLTIKAISPILSKFNFIDERISKSITLF